MNAVEATVNILAENMELTSLFPYTAGSSRHLGDTVGVGVYT